MPYEGQARVGDGAPAPARVDLDAEALQVEIAGSAPVRLDLVDIEDLHDEDYVLMLTDHEGVRYELTMFGRAYGQLLADVSKARDAALEKNLLLTGVKLQDSFPGKVFGGGEPVPVTIRLYEDLLVVVPERGTMFGVPYSFVERVDWDEELYQVHVITDDGRHLVFGHLAKRSEEFRDELRRLLDGLGRRTAATLGALLPGTPASTLGSLAQLMRDGRAAQRWQIDAIHPSIWPRLETVAAGTEELRAAYDRLAAMTVKPWAAFGVKAVKAGEEPEEAGAEVAASAGEPITDLWYFCPIQVEGRPVNAVAQEVASQSGHATYVFRLMPPDRFVQLGDDDLAAAVSASVARLNRALLQLNFRREPIYLSEEELVQGSFARYRVALRKLDYLREARAAFLGRAIHNASWESQVRSLLERA